MERRRAEIEAKKARLAELRRQRESRQQQFSSAKVASETTPADRKADVDRLVASLIGEQSRPTSSQSERPLESEERKKESKDELGTTAKQEGTKEQEMLTRLAPSIYLDIPPPAKKETILYSKEVQTTEPWTPEIEEKVEVARSQVPNEKPVMVEGLNEPGITAPSKREAKQKPPAIGDEELTSLLSSTRFHDFIERSTKVIERTLDEEYDVLTDYSTAAAGMDEPLASLQQVIQFRQNSKRKRAVTSIEWSYKFPELCLSSYVKGSSFAKEPDGLVHVWNMHLHDRPEYTFHGQSDVLVAKFSSFHPSLVVGGTYSGQVLLWDMRSRAQPVLRTPLTGGGHTHPIYNLSIVGTQNANNIITCSTDGLVCGWTVDLLSQPQEIVELATPPPAKADEMVPTALAFPATDPNFFLVGTEEGSIYPVNRYHRAGARAGVDPKSVYKGHSALVTGLDFHPPRGPLDLGDLLLSSGLDWGVHLWSVKAPMATGTSGAAAGTHQPLLRLDREDAIYDAKWSPIRPAIWAAVDGAGYLEVWNMSTDIEMPVARAAPETEDAGLAGLNKLAWERHEGCQIAVGGLDGALSIFDVGVDLGGQHHARPEEWQDMKKLVNRLRKE